MSKTATVESTADSEAAAESATDSADDCTVGGVSARKESASAN